MKSSAIIGKEFPNLETERLVLRQITLEDVDAVREQFADPEVTEFLDIPPMESNEQAELVILYTLGLFERNEGIRWAISRKGDNHLIGSCGFESITKVRCRKGQIKYDLARDHWGHGLMSEAMNKVLEYGFEKIHLNRIEAFVVDDAEKPQELLRRLGFRKEGVMRGHGYWKERFWDEALFSLLRDEWKAGDVADNG
jgi:[ribosomal protein S5]-alanine N-acetyltransferase